MAQNAVEWLNAPILYLDIIDSTNNYAMQLIDADKAQAGTTVLTKSQSSGKGQRGKVWNDAAGESLLMSLITAPPYSLEQQFIFSALTANAIADVLDALDLTYKVKIKWPNDIIINDKKAGGILIENVLRGSKWSFAVIGFGLNVQQESFSKELPTATSLKIISGKTFKPEQLVHLFRQAIIEPIIDPPSDYTVMKRYNERLYQRGEWQTFLENGEEKWYQIQEVLPNGQLSVLDSYKQLLRYNHGELTWVW